MTSTIPTMRTADEPRTTVPDTRLVLRRADRDWRRDTADDPAPDGYLEHLATALLTQVVGPLARDNAGVSASENADAFASDPAALQALADDNAALAKEVAGLRADAVRHTATVAELDQAQQALTDVRGENTQLQTTLTGLQAELAAARAQLAERTAAAAATGLHRHLYPWIEGTRDAGPCACGHPFPRTAPREATELARPAAAAEPLDVLFGRLRRQLPGWPAA